MYAQASMAKLSRGGLAERKASTENAIMLTDKQKKTAPPAHV